MVRDRLINLFSDTLLIDKTYIFDDSNLRTLCVLSNYLEGLDKVDKKKVIVSKDGLKRHALENIEYKGTYVYADISFLFENNGNKSVIYKDWTGRDGFYNFEMLELLLILEIENNFNIQIPDDQACSFETVGQALSYIEELSK